MFGPHPVRMEKQEKAAPASGTAFLFCGRGGKGSLKARSALETSPYPLLTKEGIYRPVVWDEGVVVNG